MASPPPDLLTSGSSAEEVEVGEGGKDGGGGREKEVLIGRILELQNTLHDLTQRVNSVKEENSKLKSENEVDFTGQGTLSHTTCLPLSPADPQSVH